MAALNTSCGALKLQRELRHAYSKPGRGRGEGGGLSCLPQTSSHYLLIRSAIIVIMSVTGDEGGSAGRRLDERALSGGECAGRVALAPVAASCSWDCVSARSQGLFFAVLECAHAWFLSAQCLGLHQSFASFSVQLGLNRCTIDYTGQTVSCIQ